MRNWVLIGLATCLLAGCSSPSKEDFQFRNTSPATPAKSAQAKIGKEDRPVAKPKPKPTGKEITPLDIVVGRVAAVNPALRFVVLDFPPGSLPQVERRMDVFRNGRRIGEVKITGPARDTNIAADISEGEAAINDEVRSQ